MGSIDVPPMKVQRLVLNGRKYIYTEMENKLKSILYLTVNTVNNKIYVGIHITEKPYEFDGYYGNGITGTSCYWFKHPKYPFLLACKKYGLKVFRRYTLFVFDTYDDARKMEALIVDADFIKRPDTYNVTLGGGSGLVPSTEIPVYQYDLEGNFILEYRSKSDAARKIGKNTMSICCATLYKSICAGYYWSETKVMKLNVSDMTKKQAKPVYLYNTDGSFVTELASIAACSRKLEVGDSSVKRAIEGQTKCGGYYISFDKVEAFIKTPKKKLRAKVYYLYNTEGTFLAERSLLEVKTICKNHYAQFHHALQQQYTCAGYYWSVERYDVFPLKHSGKRKIYQYDLNGNLIKVWDSYRECNKQFSRLRYVLNGTASQTKGFVFKYEIDN